MALGCEGALKKMRVTRGKQICLVGSLLGFWPKTPDALDYGETQNMTKYLGILLVVLSFVVTSSAGAGTFNGDPNASRLTFKLSGLPTISVPHNGTGGAALTGTDPNYTLTASAAVWSTVGRGPGTSLFTGVPLLSNLVLTVQNGAGTFAPASDIQNPVGPGMIQGIRGVAALSGTAIVDALGGIPIPFDLQNVGGANATTDKLTLGDLATLELTLGPWFTDVITMNAVTTNIVQLPQRIPVETGLPFTLDPASTEEVKTYTLNGGFVTDWEASHPNTPLSGVKADVLKVTHTVTIGGSVSFPSAGETGTITLITPLRINTTEKLVKTIPGVMRQKFSFVPEPSTLLLLVSGAVGLVLVGRSRMRK
jgi:hypothetical protein